MAGMYKCTKKGSGGTSMPDFQTAETDTGIKWIDGKNIYCTVFSYNTEITLYDGSPYTVGTYSYIDKLINVKVSRSGTYARALLVNALLDASNVLKINSNIANAQNFNRIVLYYTKQ